jgi:hypothetical protein
VQRGWPALEKRKGVPTMGRPFFLPVQAVFATALEERW